MRPHGSSTRLGRRPLLACRTMLIILGVNGFFFLALRTQLRDVRYSLFHAPSREDVESVHNARNAWASSYIAALERSAEAREKAAAPSSGLGRSARQSPVFRRGDRPRVNGTRAEFCLGFLSSQSRPGLLLAAVASTLRGGALDDPDTAIRIFYSVRDGGRDAAGTDQAVAEHTAKVEAGLVPGSDVWRLGRAGLQLVHLNHTCESLNWEQCGTRDYLAAVSACADVGAAYTVLIEEDTWATPDVMRKMREAVWGVEEVAGGGWLCLKLFATSFAQGCSSEDYHSLAFGYLPVCLVGACVIVAPAAALAITWWSTLLSPAQDQAPSGDDGGPKEPKRGGRCAALWLRCVWARGWLSPAFLGALRATVGEWRWSLLGLGVNAGAAAFVFLVCAGRQHLGLSQLSQKGIHRLDFGASTLAIVYPAATARALAGLTAAPSDMGQDIVVWEYSRNVSQPLYAVVPCLFEHTGVNTSSADKRLARSSWSWEDRYKVTKFASRFEDWDPSDLALAAGAPHVQ